jgi:glycosyltransferase involved in cell wall biosynthesis
MNAQFQISPVDFTLFVPCLNEAPRVEGTLDTVRLAMVEINRSYELLVVDDGSTDGTSVVVESYAARHPEMRIRLHRNPVNQGVAYSFVEAAFMGVGEYFRLIWGDNVEPIETLVSILSQAGKADLIIPYYPIVPGKSGFRMALSGLYTEGVNAISGFRLHYYNGSVLCRRFDAMRWAPHNHGFTGFLADMITQLLAEGATYIEVPVQGKHVNKGGKATPLTLHNFVSTALTLISIFQRRFSYWIFRDRLLRLRKGKTQYSESSPSEGASS